MALQTVPAATRAHRARLDRIVLAMLLAVRRAWRQLDPSGPLEEQYTEEIGPRIFALVLAAQVAATLEANRYVPEVLAELGIPAADGIRVPSNAFGGYAGDGRPLDSLLAGAVGRTRSTFAQARDAALGAELDAQVDFDEALRLLTGDIDFADFDAVVARELAAHEGESFLQLAAETVIADTARAAESAALTGHPAVQGYYRMLKPPSCSRCAILAGRFYRWNDGFERHPRCDCVHIPAAEATGDDMRLDVDAYFESLTGEQQDRVFTKAGAQAIRDGADPVQVVNARRGMERAQDGAQAGLLITRESTTRRGAANRRRTGRNAVVRLMPESIYDVASDRADAIRLLRLNGFLT